ncbi:unnamed protein product [Rhizoctonia solani]|uniref:Uncharacterized protein n=1 Tax=Rhizoctonia solani TaxID=456999 RepID=A0A8H2WPS9_9AGAM|nr:unnamed protein product [Rhizoctonia solani]
MVNNVSGATAPVAGTAADQPAAQYLNKGKSVKITFPNGTQQIVPVIPKPTNIKKCKGMEAFLDFGPGKTFSHGMYLDIQSKFRNDMSSLLGNVAIPWEEVPYDVRANVLVSVKAAYPVLYRFPEDWVGKMMMKKVCKNKRDTNTNKRGRLRGNGANTNAQDAGEPMTEDEPAVEEQAVEDEPMAEDEPAVEEQAVEDEPMDKDEPTVEEPAVEDKPMAEPAVEEQAVEEPAVEDEPMVEDEPAVKEQVVEDEDNSEEQVIFPKGMRKHRRIEDSDDEELTEPNSSVPSTIHTSSPAPSTTPARKPQSNSKAPGSKTTTPVSKASTAAASKAPTMSVKLSSGIVSSSGL